MKKIKNNFFKKTIITYNKWSEHIPMAEIDNINQERKLKLNKK